MKVIDNNGVEVFFSTKNPIANHKVTVRTRTYQDYCEIDITADLVNRLDEFFKTVFNHFDKSHYYQHRTDYTKMRSPNCRNQFYIKDKKIIMTRAKDSVKRSTSFQHFNRRKAESFMCNLDAALKGVSVEVNNPSQKSILDSILSVHKRYGFDAWYRSDEEFLTDPDVLNVRLKFNSTNCPTKLVRDKYLNGVSVDKPAKQFVTYGGLEWVEKVIKNIR